MNTKLLIGLIVASILLIAGAAFLLSASSAAKPKLEKTAGAKIQVLEKSFDFKDIAYSGGLAIHEFPIKNIGDKDLQIANMATSCMCTKVYLKGPDGNGPRAGMKGMSSGQTGWVGLLKSGQEGKIVGEFDPAYHGPQGVGPMSRILSFETNDPDSPYVELELSGVVKK